jgi:hypothetical protein
MYISLRSAQSAALRAAADSILADDDKSLFNATVAIISRAKAERDKIAHGVWTVCDDLPNDLILVNPRYALARIATLVEIWATRTHLNASDNDFDKDKLFVYKPTDFAAIKEQCTRALRLADWLASYLHEPTESRTGGSTHQSLCGAPEIQLEISRQKQNAQNSQ